MATSIDNILRQAFASFQAGKLDEAERYFKKALQRQPKNFAALNLLSIILMQLERHGEAENFIKSALRVDSNTDATFNNYGIILKTLKRPSGALERFSQAIAINPENAVAWNNRSTVFNDLKRYADAIEDFDKAASLDNRFSEAFYNKGNSLSQIKRYDEAFAAYDTALALNPNSAASWVGRGNVFDDIKRYDEAFAAYDKALALDPNSAEAWLGRGNVFNDLKRHDEAIVAFDKALTLRPSFAEAWIGRGQALNALKRTQESIVGYRQALKFGGDSELINYYLASLGAEPPPIASPQSYVVNLFDFYADNFERHLVDDLKYRVPTLIVNAVRRFVSSDSLDILDLGCGTGLVGQGLHPLVRTLTGVDLSTNMLEKARQREIYDRLNCSELIQFLQTQDSMFDLAVAADVFIYIGDLSLVFRGVRRALRDGGFFCFSVETTDENDFVLRSTQRYAHSNSYLQRLAEQNRFVVEAFDPQIVRQEFGVNVDGYLATLRCV